MAAVVVVVIPSEADAGAVNEDDVDNVEIPLMYFPQSLTSGQISTYRGGSAVGARTSVTGEGRILDNRQRQRR